jgi:hypothetical protein
MPFPRPHQIAASLLIQTFSLPERFLRLPTRARAVDLPPGATAFRDGETAVRVVKAGGFEESGDFFDSGRMPPPGRARVAC